MRRGTAFSWCRRSQTDGPLMLLVIAALAAAPAIASQGGGMQQAFVAVWSVLAAPMIALEAMAMVARAVQRIEAGLR